MRGVSGERIENTVRDETFRSPEEKVAQSEPRVAVVKL